MKIAIPLCVAVFSFFVAVGEQQLFAQATQMQLINATDKPIVFSIELPEQTVHYVLDEFTSTKFFSLKKTQDDRVLIARSAGGNLFSDPCKVYATTSFNAAYIPNPKIEAILYEHPPGEFDIIFRVDDKPFPDNEAEAEILAKHSKAIERAIENVKDQAESKP